MLKRKIDRRQDGHDIFAQIGIVGTDQPRDGRTRGADDRPFDVLSGQILTGISTHQLGRAGNLKHVVKSKVKQTADDISDVIQIVELSVQRRRGQRHRIFILVKNGQRVVRCLFCFVGTHTNALTAVDAAHGIDDRVPVSDADGLGRTALQTRRTAPAFFDIK